MSLSLSRLSKAALASLATLVILAVSACSGGTSLERTDDGLAKLTVFQITTVDSTPLYLGIEQGFFEEEGLDVEVRIAEAGSAIIPSVMNGESQIGYANAVSDLAAIDQGLDLRFVSNCCGIGNDPALDASGIFVLPDSPIQDLTGLSNAKIAVNSTKNLGDLTINQAVTNAGGDPSTIEYVPMNYSDMAGALERGDVDAIWSVEPFRTASANAGFRQISSNFVESFPDTVIGYYVTSADFAEANPEVVAQFQRAMDKTNQYASEHPEDLRRLAVEKVGLSPEVAEELNFNTFTPGLDVESLRRVGAASLEQGLISEEPNYDELVIQPQG